MRIFACITFFYAGLLGLKILAMCVLTSSRRFKTKSFASPEDCAFNNDKVKQSDSALFTNVLIDFRAHLNDLENISIFLLVSLGYLNTGPSYTLALYLFRIYALDKFLHMIVYVLVVIPQPARALSFSIGYFITICMAVVTLISLF
ncbi:microsomal glutathione S-transferase 1-like [Rhynchophorus ferrugineus]|uniref:microsomal glutathione S-transferase 1-like n=1 Tax=Rhynchophorus ferrugineus TaxID=354439 RepID=UPI003FCDEED9